MNKEKVIHELKISPQYFVDVINSNKRFEIRKYDRDYKVGDFLLLREFENGKYTGNCSELLQIRYILNDCPEYGLMNGYCILSW